MSYQTGVFSCFDDVGVCLLGTCVPCYLTARTIGGERQPVGQGLNVLWCFLGTCCACVPCAAWVGRTKVQDAYSIKEDICTRCILWCCLQCQICQDAREINLRNGSLKNADVPS